MYNDLYIPLFKEVIYMKRVLITDDAVLMRNTLRDILQQLNFNVVGEAVNGVEAIEKFKRLDPHFVLMDITMPEMNGIDALRKIKQIDSEAVIVMCSAMGQKDLIVKAIEEGAFDFIVKPFNFYRIQEMASRVNFEIENRNIR